MRILILGGSGMLGHRLWMNLQHHHETWVTVRGNDPHLPDVPEFPRATIQTNVDALVFDEVARALAQVKPDIVINCIGLIKQQGPLAKDPIFSISLNALFPHRIALICQTAGVRMIHVSTDCVYSGRGGGYRETEQSDAEDLYGRTKFLGEIDYLPHVITLRTSIIGRELKSRLGLIEWFLSQKETIRGFKKAIYSGFTTDELARIILEHIIPRPDLYGMYHISSEPISKYDLLMLARKEFEHDVDILPDETFFCDRSLNSDRFRQATEYLPPSWPEMIHALAKTSGFYNSIK